MNGRKLSFKSTKNSEEDDIKILLATTLISIILAAFLLSTQIPIATAATNQTQQPTGMPPEIIRVKEKVGSVILWTPILIVTSPPKGYAEGEISTTTAATFIMGSLGWGTTGSWTRGMKDVTDGRTALYCELAEWTVYHVYDKDRYTGAIWRDYGYHAKVTNWKGIHATIWLDKKYDYRYLNKSTFKDGYHTVEVDLRYKEQDDDLRTYGPPAYEKIEGSGKLILDINVKVKVGEYVFTGILKIKYTCSSYYIYYYYPSGHRWLIDYLGPTKAWRWWPPGWVEVPSIATFIYKGEV